MTASDPIAGPSRPYFPRPFRLDALRETAAPARESASRQASSSRSSTPIRPAPRARSSSAYSSRTQQDDDDALLNKKRADSVKKMVDSWDLLREKYGSVGLNEDDEIDIKTGEIMKNRGRIKAMVPRKGIGEESDEEDAETQTVASEVEDEVLSDEDVLAGLGDVDCQTREQAPTRVWTDQDREDLAAFLRDEAELRELGDNGDDGDVEELDSSDEEGDGASQASGSSPIRSSSPNTSGNGDSAVNGDDLDGSDSEDELLSFDPDAVKVTPVRPHHLSPEVVIPIRTPKRTVPPSVSLPRQSAAPNAEAGPSRLPHARRSTSQTLRDLFTPPPESSPPTLDDLFAEPSSSSSDALPASSPKRPTRLILHAPAWPATTPRSQLIPVSQRSSESRFAEEPSYIPPEQLEVPSDTTRYFPKLHRSTATTFRFCQTCRASTDALRKQRSYYCKGRIAAYKCVFAQELGEEIVRTYTSVYVLARRRGMTIEEVLAEEKALGSGRPDRRGRSVSAVGATPSPARQDFVEQQNEPTPEELSDAESEAAWLEALPRAYQGLAVAEAEEPVPAAVVANSPSALPTSKAIPSPPAPEVPLSVKKIARRRIITPVSVSPAPDVFSQAPDALVASLTSSPPLSSPPGSPPPTQKQPFIYQPTPSPTVSVEPERIDQSARKTLWPPTSPAARRILPLPRGSHYALQPTPPPSADGRNSSVSSDAALFTRPRPILRGTLSSIGSASTTKSQKRARFSLQPSSPGVDLSDLFGQSDTESLDTGYESVSPWQLPAAGRNDSSSPSFSTELSVRAADAGFHLGPGHTGRITQGMMQALYPDYGGASSSGTSPEAADAATPGKAYTLPAPPRASTPSRPAPSPSKSGSTAGLMLPPPVPPRRLSSVSSTPGPSTPSSSSDAAPTIEVSRTPKTPRRSKPPLGIKEEPDFKPIIFRTALPPSLVLAQSRARSRSVSAAAYSQRSTSSATPERSDSWAGGSGSGMTRKVLVPATTPRKRRRDRSERELARLARELGDEAGLEWGMDEDVGEEIAREGREGTVFMYLE